MYLHAQHDIGRTADDAAVRAFPHRMIAAWNRGNGQEFAAPFSETAYFIAFEGTQLQGRRAIAEFHQRLFATTLRATRLEGEVRFVRFLNARTAVMHAVARVFLPGRTTTSPSRDSMQLFVCTKHDDGWRVDSLLNARRVTLERQLLLDDLDVVSAETQRQVSCLLASVKLRQRSASPQQR